jgi:nuclease HARBI1
VTQNRFYANELADLVRVLRIPDPFITKTRSKFSAIEALGLLLARFKSAGDLNDLAMMYQRPASAISEVVNGLAFWIDERWGMLLGFDTEGILAPEKLQSYAHAIHEAGAPIDSVWGFIDCTIRAMCRPFRYQRQAYNGYKKVHALKYQAVKLPNGLLGHIHGPEVGQHNDNHLLATSGLLDLCAMHAIRPGASVSSHPARRYLQLFGDPAYGNSYHLISPFSGAGNRTNDEKRWNEAMARVRIEVEHAFGGILRLWPYLNAWWKHRVYASPLGVYYRVGCLLTNAHNCIHLNQTAQYFSCEPPTLDEYFHD